MLTKPLAFLCFSGGQWQGEHSWVIGLAGESLISKSARFVWQLLPFPRGSGGCQTLASLWIWAVHGCISLELCLHLHVDVTSFLWQDRQLNMPPAPRRRVLKGAAASPAACSAMSRPEGWERLRCSFVCAVCLSYCHLKPGQPYFFFFQRINWLLQLKGKESRAVFVPFLQGYGQILPFPICDVLTPWIEAYTVLLYTQPLFSCLPVILWLWKFWYIFVKLEIFACCMNVIYYLLYL